jgi:hypothetical protein
MANQSFRACHFEPYPNGIKLVVTYYHFKGYGTSCRVHPRAVWTGPCSIPRRHASVHGSDELPKPLPREP